MTRFPHSSKYSVVPMATATLWSSVKIRWRHVHVWSKTCFGPPWRHHQSFESGQVAPTMLRRARDCRCGPGGGGGAVLLYRLWRRCSAASWRLAAPRHLKDTRLVLRRDDDTEEIKQHWFEKLKQPRVKSLDTAFYTIDTIEVQCCHPTKIKKQGT